MKKRYTAESKQTKSLKSRWMSNIKNKYTGDYRDILKVIVSGYATIILINIVIKIIYGHYPIYYFKSYYIMTHIGIFSSIIVTLFIGKRLK